MLLQGGCSGCLVPVHWCGPEQGHAHPRAAPQSSQQGRGAGRSWRAVLCHVAAVSRLARSLVLASWCPLPAELWWFPAHVSWGLLKHPPCTQVPLCSSVSPRSGAAVLVVGWSSSPWPCRVSLLDCPLVIEDGEAIGMISEYGFSVLEKFLFFC